LPVATIVFGLAAQLLPKLEHDLRSACRGHHAHADERHLLEDLAIRSIGLGSHVVRFLGEIEEIGIEGASHGSVSPQPLQKVNEFRAAMMRAQVVCRLRPRQFQGRPRSRFGNQPVNAFPAF